MMRYSQTLLDQIRDALVLSDCVSEYVSLRKTGHYHLGLCPFHSEKTPSFTVTDDKGMYFCFGCGATGSVFDFFMKMKGMSFKEAVEEAAARCGISLPVAPSNPLEEKMEKENLEIYSVLEKAALWFKSQILVPLGKNARSYLESRGISKDLQERFSLGYSPSSYHALVSHFVKEGISQEVLEKAGLVLRRNEEADQDHHKMPEHWDRFRGRLMFPIQDKKGRMVGFGARTLTSEMPKYLNSPETAVFHKGKVLYGIWEVMTNKDILKSQPLVLVEGYLDVIACWKAGIPAVAPLGTALGEGQVLEAWRFHKEPVVCFDGDLAGRKAAFRALERALVHLKAGYSLKFAHLPKGEDPASLILAGQTELIRERLKKAQSLSDFLWESMVEQKRLDTPEHQALFKKNLRALLENIKDADVKEAYLHDMMQRYHKMFRKVPWEGFKSSKKSFASFGGIPQNILSSFEVKRKQHKILILGVMKYPLLLNDVMETILTLDLEDPSLIKLREEIVGYYEQNLPLEIFALEDYLKERGCGEYLAHLEGEKLDFYASFLKGEMPLSEVKRRWNEVWIIAQERPALKCAEKKLWKEFETNMSPTIWAEIQALNLEKESQDSLIQEGLEENIE